jgi:hypothetical protein
VKFSFSFFLNKYFISLTTIEIIFSIRLKYYLQIYHLVFSTIFLFIERKAIQYVDRWESFEFLLTTKRLMEHEGMKPVGRQVL